MPVWLNQHVQSLDEDVFVLALAQAFSNGMAFRDGVEKRDGGMGGGVFAHSISSMASVMMMMMMMMPRNENGSLYMVVVVVILSC